jgi:hypothetical protein
MIAIEIGDVICDEWLFLSDKLVQKSFIQHLNLRGFKNLWGLG